MKTSSISAYRFGWMGFALFGFVLLVGTSAVSGAADSPATMDMRLFYQYNCVRCHGADGTARNVKGKNLRGQDFTDAKWRKETPDGEMVKTILKGKFFGWAMPAFKAMLSKEDAERMVTEVIRKAEKNKVIEPEPKTAAPAH